jgi:hypothetical protein
VRDTPQTRRSARGKPPRAPLPRSVSPASPPL